ncbi:MAG: phosphoethanolamine--lipid A transferase, partial [Gammaproteobacteria bacterium]
MEAIGTDPESTALQSPVVAESLWHFLAPRYWRGWLLVAWLRLSAYMPWRVAIRLHRGIGRSLWLVMGRHRGVVERNIRSCFPGLRDAEVRRLARTHFENVGACLAETAFAWFGEVGASLTSFRIEGDEHVNAALAKGRGVILYTGHFTPIEICAPILKARFPLFGFMFHARRNALLNEFQRRGRRTSAHLSFPSDNVRSMLGALRRNAVVWYASDQHFASRSTTVLPFFGAPAKVSTAAFRLARSSGAAIVPFSYRRLPDDSGYMLSFEPAIEHSDNEDETVFTRRLLGVLERFIRRCPEQYVWTRQFLKSRTSACADWDCAAARELPQSKASMGSTLFAILGVALFIAAFDNNAFFAGVYQATKTDEHQLAILVSMFLLVMTTLVLILSLVPGRRVFKTIAAGLLVSAAAVGYFMSYYGVVIDPSMIRNVMETDVREASPLLTSDFLLHVAAFGLVPAGLVSLWPLRSSGWRRALCARTVAVVGSVLLLSGSLYANFGPVSFFAHQNHALRMQINPFYPLFALYAYGTRADDAPPPVREPLPAERIAGGSSHSKPTLFVFVMGETARADRFSLNGYARDTNRYTRDYDIVNFPHVTSCGTSTADSVPCIFSRFSHDDFSHAKFAKHESLFQTLERLGIEVAWRDNSTGCKRICDEENFEELAGAGDPVFCHNDVCVDEILLDGFSGLVADDPKDRFIVLHQRGSHGPAYYTDTPQFAKAWLPECNSPGIRNCDSASINNAYDNTMLYTDYFLARLIEALKGQSDRYQTAMFYVSDHGESLGEKGLYLHGLPYALAPAEQTHVPMLFWASDDFYADHSIDERCMQRVAAAPITHDVVFHSILPLFDIVSPTEDHKLDIFAECRSEQANDHMHLSAHDR